ncbi:hypothetical protein FEM48_Zijuj07G0119900 [Ziziphus jujuba var. spinosa]|uniref:F-box domain-containing protein n=1 Tax=Ziziphus jujuba var. spinosa TaxID=714518 RepID=A0A978V4I0_ZIZJJ|nr:F-box protein At2g05970-like [Ziziphus jujuba var. spinosa]XP_048333961.1 F-box protein At2g05970-like [Ziziphus jujuba var. spinosa]XP_048333962.1 F-box protein At2g05970-like [Ziziphus jujuba var. spinosa]KAH7522263.1 hypothetical protein FEM48_Zijuj07G0119900 [Ziziphus jujuba var. spinosa]
MAKRCSTQSDWSNLPTELLDLIPEKLDFVDLVCFKAVCSSWKMVAESYMKSSPLYNQIPPLLMPYDELENDPTCPARKFVNLADDRSYRVKKVFGRFSDACCIGSSCGWLVVMDEKSNPNLVNPFSGVEIQLPSLKNLPECRQILKNTRWSRNFIIVKAIISSYPSHCKNFIAVILVHTHVRKMGNRVIRLAFCKQGDKTWKYFGDEHNSYSDILFHKDQLYALSRKLAIVEVWDFQDQYFPTKVMSIDCSTQLDYWRSYGNDLYIISLQCYKVLPYLLESMGQILLGLRLAGKYGGYSYRYLTSRFAICKLDYSEKRWVFTKSLSDRAELIAEYDKYRCCVDCERKSIYNRDEYLFQSTVLLDSFYY